MKRGWAELTLGEVGEVVGGGTPKTSVATFWGGGIPWATPKDLSDQRTRYVGETARTITHDGLNSSGARILPVTSVLLSSRAPIGLVAINTVPMATNQGFKSIIPDRSRIDPAYLAYWLEANTRYLQSLGSGATFKEISKSVVEKVTIPLPPLVEQRQIAQVLDQADMLRRQRRRSIDVAAALVQALFAEMFSDANDSDENIVLADLVDACRPITYGILKPGPDIPNGVPYVRVVDIQDGEIVADGVRRTSTTIASEYRRSVLAPGDLVMSIRGHVGRLAAVPDRLAGANITQDSARIAIRDFDPRYVMEAIRAPSIQRWMSRHVKGVAVRGINLADVKRIPIPPALLSAQREFAARAREVDRVATSARAHLRHLDALFASLQHRAFIGEL